MRIDRISGVTLAVVAVVVLEETWRLRLPLGTLANPGPGYVPVLLALGVLIAGVLLATLSRSSATLAEAGWNEWRHSVAIVAVCAFAALGLERLGYRLTMGLVCAILLGVVERKRLLTTALVAVALAAGTYFLFDTLLRVPLPRGPLGL
jgi:putative tricarboxylic transport membrane protein